MCHAEVSESERTGSVRRWRGQHRFSTIELVFEGGVKKKKKKHLKENLVSDFLQQRGITLVSGAQESSSLQSGSCEAYKHSLNC